MTNSLRHRKGPGQVDRAKRELVWVDPRHRKLPKVLIKQVSHREPRRFAILRNNRERAPAVMDFPPSPRFPLKQVCLPARVATPPRHALSTSHDRQSREDIMRRCDVSG